jgi:hypothetical protein
MVTQDVVHLVGGMTETNLLVAPAWWATGRAPDPAPLLEQLATLRVENATLRAQNAALQERIRELEARLGRLLRRGQENPDLGQQRTVASCASGGRR